MLPLHELRPRRRILPIHILMRTPIHRPLPIQKLAKRRRQLVVRRVPGRPQRIPAVLWHGVVMQMRHSGRLRLMHQIRMPARRAARLPEVRLPPFLDLQVRPHDRHAGRAGDLRHLRVDFDDAEVLAQLLLLLGGDVLVAEEDDAALGDEEGELVFLLVRQLRQLDTV